MKNIIESIKDNKDNYEFDQIDCTEKAFGIVLDSYKKGYSGIFYMYMKLYQVYNIRESKYSQFNLIKTIDLAQDVINYNFGGCVKQFTPQNGDFFQFINEKIDDGYPLLIPGNLRGLYYSKHYNSLDHAHLFVIKGYSSENEIYYILDNLHIDPNISNYKDFNIEYSTIRTINELYFDEENKGIFYIENKSIKEQFEIYIDCIDLYLTSLTKQPYKEVDFINFIINKLEAGQLNGEIGTPMTVDYFRKKIDVNQLTSRIINTVKYKEVFFTEIINFALKYVSDTSILKEIGILKSILIEKWNLIINKSIKNFLLNRLFKIEEQLEEVISYEKKMHSKLEKLKDLIIQNNMKEESNTDGDFSKDTLEFYEVDGERKDNYRDDTYSVAEYKPPTSKIQKELAHIWREILGIDNIGVKDNFFYLGGNSVKAINAIVEIQKRLNIELELTDVFKNPTIKELEEYIQEGKQKVYSVMKSAEEKEYYPLSYAQKRIYTLQQFDKKSTGYNVTNIFIIEGKINKNKVEEILNKLIERHESLRTSFEIVAEEVVQRVHDSVGFKVDYEDIRGRDTQRVVEEFKQVFDLSRAPLLRVKIAKASDNEYLLMTDIHHIVFDGISFAILIKESILLSQNKVLPDLKIQYKDFALWQRELLENKKMGKENKYWLDKFSGEITTLNIPTDYDRQFVKSSKGDEIRVKLSLEVTNKLKEVSRNTGTTFHMILLSIYYILLSKYSGQEDIMVGTITSGRKNANVQNVVGMFVNTLVLRNYPRKEKTFLEFLEEVKKSTLEAYENQDYPFEELMKDLNYKNDPRRSPLFDTLFIMQNLESLDIEVEGLKFKKYQLEEEEETSVDISLTAFEINEVIELSFVYCIGLFKRDTILRLSKDFQTILITILQELNCKLENISLLNEEEKADMKLEIEELEDLSSIEIDF